MQRALAVLSRFSNADRLGHYDQALKHRISNVHFAIAETDSESSACVRTAEGFGVHHVHWFGTTKLAPSAKGSGKFLATHQHLHRGNMQQWFQSRSIETWELKDGLPNTPFLEELIAEKTSKRPTFESQNSPWNAPSIALFFSSQSRSPITSCDRTFTLDLTGVSGNLKKSMAVAITLTTLSHHGMLASNFTEQEKAEIKLNWLIESYGHKAIAILNQEAPGWNQKETNTTS
eukprot:TRINITY_DN1387_c0_g1_i1.p1 TRINITY_DN1387_c0_g1~~TRINITY_DN1387_c0_g1_i1.p1  ORF type:complete len:232 (-),score=24.01 TRINITY_DN1387_c0_g1_i1:30-725(-)